MSATRATLGVGDYPYVLWVGTFEPRKNVPVLVEAFRDGEAGAAHVNSAHFKQAQQDLPQHLVATPKIISQMIDQDDWSELGELAVN